jgi:hypothetical protein
MLSLLALSPACGGGGGGPGPDGAGQGLVLVSFLQNGVGNLPLNQKLEFRFSEAVNPVSISNASLQIREGPSFGRAVTGTTTVVGSTVFFEPQLPGLCDLSDAGFKPDTQYRVTLVGYPEEFSIKNTQDQPLRGTLNFEFHTRLDTDPLLFTDQIAATSPVVTASTPQNGTPVVRVETTPGQVNQIVLNMSENLDPCTISDATVLFFEYQRGDPTVFNLDAGTGRTSGFTPITDGDPGNPFSWGPIAGGETNLPPNQQRIRALIELTQSFSATTLTITPEFGRFPENALCVLQLTFGIKDLGGSTLVPFTLTFTTENLAAQNGTYDVKFEGETPILVNQSTADVDTARSPNRAQGWLLFAGDGDNGPNQLIPTLPNVPALCLVPRQVNDGNKDDFDPVAPGVNLDTGLSRNTCLNSTDGSVAVIWEFRTLRIRSGVTVRIIGVNPAILLVQGTALIENGGRLLARGDGQNGTLTNVGANGTTVQNQDATGGKGYAGGGDGGLSHGFTNVPANTYALSGRTGDGSPSGYGVAGGTGAGLGGSHATTTAFTANGHGGGGGGGGHSTVGGTGGVLTVANTPHKGPPGSGGGVVYPAMDNRLLTPSAGSGGGGAGTTDNTSGTFAGYEGSGGGGGAGGGFVDITSQGQINIFGTIDVAGGRGGTGGVGFYVASAGAGGGSGGGIRLLTPGSINVTGAILTAAGGQAGAGAQRGGGGIVNLNNGGAGGLGRIAMEDGDSIITGQGAAVTLVPNEGDTGFSRGIFDASRFQGGGLTPELLSDVFFVGPANPIYTVPVVTDFVASIPAGSARGVGLTSMLIEVRGFNLKVDGTHDALTPTTWRTVGYFTHSGVANLPNWVPNANPPVLDIPTLPAGNGGAGIAGVNGREFLQMRVTFYLPITMGPFDPGPILDDWTIRFVFDQ